MANTNNVFAQLLIQDDKDFDAAQLPLRQRAAALAVEVSYNECIHALNGLQGAIVNALRSVRKTGTFPIKDVIELRQEYGDVHAEATEIATLYGLLFGEPIRGGSELEGLADPMGALYSVTEATE